MKILGTAQTAEVGDPVRAKFAMVVPVLEGTLLSLSRERVARLGGNDKVTLADLAREYRAGDGDTGICFEYAVHQAIAGQEPLIYPFASEVLADFCKIDGGAESILFGPEKDGVIPIVESVTNALTDESRVYVGNAGSPPKLKRYIPQIVAAFHRHEERNKLPRSINGLWKADLFVGNHEVDRWVGTTVKINQRNLESARGLRIAIYPKSDSRDTPRLDRIMNLVRLPLSYDQAFMEIFYKSFFLTRAVLRADAQIPRPVDLPDSEDRLVARELQDRRDFPLVDVLETLRAMAQPNLLEIRQPVAIAPTAELSEADGLREAEQDTTQGDDLVSIAPEAQPAS
jgi:hypothetical protein